MIAPGHDICPYLVAADVMITDHSSAGFEFLLRDRPIVRIHRPALIREANIHPDYVELLASVSESVDGVDDAVAAVERALADPDARSDDAPRRRRGSLPSSRRRDRPLRSRHSTKRSSSTRRLALVSARRRTMPAVSVIMPAYNVEPYIGDGDPIGAGQTFTDFELIVVDDGSTDGTAEVVAGTARASDPRVRLVQQANRGLAGARNIGAARRARRRASRCSTATTCGSRTFSRSRWRSSRPGPRSTSSPATAGASAGPQHGAAGAAVSRCAARSPTSRRSSATRSPVFIMSVFRRRVYDDRSAASTRRCARNEDYDFWLRAAVAGFSFARNDRPLGHYRIRTDSLSASDMRMLRGILHVYTKLRPLIAGTAARAGDPRRPDRAVRDRAGSPRRRGWRSRARDFDAAREHLGALHARRGGAALGVARCMARWAPACWRGSTTCAAHARAGRADVILCRDHERVEVSPSSSRPTTAPPICARRSQPRRRCARPAPGRSSSSTTTRPTTRAPSSKRGGRRFPVPLRYVFEPRAGTQPGAERRHPHRARRDHRHDRRRRAGRAGLAGSRRRGTGAPAVRLRRRPRAADLGRAAAGLAARTAAASTGR